MNKTMTEIDKQIEQAERRVRELQKQRREEKRQEARKNKKKRGRKPLDNNLIERARKMAETKTLPDTALSLGIALSSLYNKGISRKAINKEMALKSHREPHREATENSHESTQDAQENRRKTTDENSTS